MPPDPNSTEWVFLKCLLLPRSNLTFQRIIFTQIPLKNYILPFSVLVRNVWLRPGHVAMGQPSTFECLGGVHFISICVSRNGTSCQTLEDQLAQEYADKTPEARLKRLLSVRTVVSTASSFAERQQAAMGVLVDFREIGTGSIGKVFEHPGTVFAYKLPLLDDSAKLWNNYIRPSRDSSMLLVCSPSDRGFFWYENLHRFPNTEQFPRQPRNILCLERIFPLPKPTREALIDKYCPAWIKSQISANEASKDCLIRPYLGCVKYSSGQQFFSLHNFQLHANQVLDLGMDATELLSPLKEEQAVRNIINLRQILALRPNSSTYEVATHSNVDFPKRLTSLWLIDFDDCHDIAMDMDDQSLLPQAEHWTLLPTVAEALFLVEAQALLPEAALPPAAVRAAAVPTTLVVVARVEVQVNKAGEAAGTEHSLAKFGGAAQPANPPLATEELGLIVVL
ncbi:hypothetical protein ISF_00381 [Cordyceps fumosorosea ARSEF 2679]|uniref:Uncharacterized protein n=1 Tax=Cordyceps fumosorosea (strain ARSEF 2679) TaxID=1081104 RepID=A0A168E7Z5_CORFA|nr:hypothetical protein ISF_00381 [Cordyceps fumosorosea ARSEF 2679]OAA73480.1 hypothetical protein ISF_00381 [Cordyceps fumosorosea ARSEF 2679]